MPRIVDHLRLADFAANLARIKADIAAAAAEAGRTDAITVVAAAKQQDAASLRAALAAGCRVFGENRIQEAMAKWPPLRAEFRDVELHLIGPLQSNKANEAVALFDVIESVDRPKIARALAVEMARQARRPRLFVQVNTGEEPQKAGVSPEAVDHLIRQCAEEFGLATEGMMCIPPAADPPAPHFALLAKMAMRNGLNALSMGMSADYAAAVRLGATHVRIGTALFGARTDVTHP